MTSLPPPSTKKFSEDTTEKKVYNIVEKLSGNIPVPNDRNRLGYCLYKFVKGEGDNPEILVKSTKIKIVEVSPKELAQKLNEELVNAKLVEK
ncbi:MAG: hypothetical protein NTX22_14945 [Ignavibacteriales bacterium]|nr:hypothetical protein [Ignavibacteriales bacterium]